MFGTGRLLALASLACIATAATTRAQNLVNFGDAITEPGVYVLNGNQSGSGNGINIRSSDVTLLLLRFTLRGDGNYEGIRVDAYENVTIWGGRVTDFGTGIRFQESQYCTVKDTRIDGCTNDGLDLDEVMHCAFVRIRADHNGGDGVSARDCRENRFFSVRGDGNDGDGMRLGDADPVVALGRLSAHNRISKCWFAYNGADGLRLRGADFNEIFENQCVANERVGIHLESNASDESLALPGSDDNEVARNWCPLNGIGIAVELGSMRNEIHDDIALASFDVDLYDNSEPPCANTWFLNFFLTRGGDGAGCVF